MKTVAEVQGAVAAIRHQQQVAKDTEAADCDQRDMLLAVLWSIADGPTNHQELARAALTVEQERWRKP